MSDHLGWGGQVGRDERTGGQAVVERGGRLNLTGPPFRRMVVPGDAEHGYFCPLERLAAGQDIGLHCDYVPSGQCAPPVRRPLPGVVPRWLPQLGGLGLATNPADLEQLERMAVTVITKRWGTGVSALTGRTEPSYPAS